MRRPYNGRDIPRSFGRESEDTVHVIWHHDECVQFDVPLVVGNLNPAAPNDMPNFVQGHFAASHVAEQARASSRADREEERATLGVVEVGHADRHPPTYSRRDVHLNTASIAVRNSATSASPTTRG